MILSVGSWKFTAIKISASQKMQLPCLSVKLKYISNFSHLKILVSFDECKINQYDRKFNFNRPDWIPQWWVWENAVFVVNISDHGMISALHFLQYHLSYALVTVHKSHSAKHPFTPIFCWHPVSWWQAAYMGLGVPKGANGSTGFWALQGCVLSHT